MGQEKYCKTEKITLEYFELQFLGLVSFEIVGYTHGIEPSNRIDSSRLRTNAII